MRPAIDVVAAERAVTDLLLAIGEDPTSAELVETPARVAEALATLLTPRPAPLRVHRDVQQQDESYDELVVVRDLPFWSMCADHLAPFGGVAHVAYGPGPVEVGATQVAHAVDRCARRLQRASRLPIAIATELEREFS